MQWSQSLRQFGRKIFPNHHKDKKGANSSHETPPPVLKTKKKNRRWTFFLMIVLVLLLIWPFLALWRHKINDNINFQGQQPPQGGSYSVAMMSSLLDQELQQGWVANAPFFLPAALLDNMPNYQIGMIGALGRFSFELEDQIGRKRGSSAADSDLEEARALLQYDPKAWVVGQGSILPIAPAQTQYRKGRSALLRYNQRVAAGEAVFDARADNLMAVLERMALDLGAASAELDDQVMNRRKVLGLFDFKSDNVFYSAKGRLYAYYMILKALKLDFSDIIKTRGIEKLYDDMLYDLREAASLKPFVVNNGTPNGQVFPNHLTSQGFFLLRARTKMREITDILRK